MPSLSWTEALCSISLRLTSRRSVAKAIHYAQYDVVLSLFVQFALSVKDLNLPEFRLDLLRIVCSHEHYIILNLPLGTILYPTGSGSQHSSPSGSISSTFENLDMPNVEAMGELSQEFRHFHYLSGLVLSELAQVLQDGK